MPQYLKDRLPPIANPDPSMWVDEAIWGHRYHDEQNPWLIFLEFLNVFQHENKRGRALKEVNGFNTLVYSPARRLYLRNLLFNNPKLEHLAKQSIPEINLWELWKKEMSAAPGILAPDFSYLQSRFHGFKEFAEVVSLLKSTGLEVNTNKRWSSKFVFPYGQDCLYEDLNKTAQSNDRNFFGRTGEMLYLILSRGSQSELLGQLLRQHLIMQESPWNKIVKALQPEVTEHRDSELGKSFLPYPKHPCYDALVADWITILKLGMPGYDALPHLVNLAGFHLIQYQLRVSRDVARITEPFKIVCEVVAPKKTLVREISCDLYQQNNVLSGQAVMAYIEEIENSQEWKTALTQSSPFARCKAILQEKVLWGDEEYKGGSTPEDLIGELKTSARRRHAQHVANIHRNYGREIGLVSKRGTIKLRYAPNDDFLKALLYANVENRIELNLFLSKLWDRYGLIFGDREAEAVLPKDEFDKKSFQANARRLEQRLASLGLLKRLSDGCAYVLNPYSRRTS